MTKIKSEIHTDKRNYRKHSDENKRIINKSLSELGAGRSILIDSEDEIIAGNGVFEEAQKNNIPIKVIETDGTELIAVKRKDLKTKDKKRQKLALIDNHASDTSEFDMELINKDFDKIELEEWGVEENNIINKSFNSLNEQFDSDKLPYPITLFLTKKEYSKWEEIKEKINEPNNNNAFNEIIKKLKL